MDAAWSRWTCGARSKLYADLSGPSSPDAEECISYGTLAFQVGGKVVAGFAAFKNRLAYLPQSGEALASPGDRLNAYERTSGSLHFAVDEPLPDDLVGRLVDAKLANLGS